MFKSIFVCGDSFPYGYELPEDTRELTNFPALIGKHFDVPVYNFSKPGAGNDRIYRVSFTELPKLVHEKPLVIIPWSQPHRAELWDTFHNSFQILHPPPGSDSKFTEMYFMYHSSEQSDVLKTIMAKVSLQNLIKQLGLNYLFIEMFDALPAVPPEYKHLEQLIDKQYFLPEYLGKHYKGCLMGASGHPLEQGHQMMSDYLITEINDRYV